eukprot:222326_1
MGSLCTTPKKPETQIGDCPHRRMQFTLNCIEKKYSNISHISTNDLYNKINSENDNSEVVILDIREEKEYSTSHIKDAIWISPKTTPQNIMNTIKNKYNVSDDNKDNNLDIYCYCSVGYRSSHMTQKLQTHGINNVHNLQGSIFKWVNEGKPIVDKNGNNVNKVHTYNILFGLLLDDKNKRVC